MFKFTHIILTRFNVRVGYSSQQTSSEAWLEHRFKLFDMFCYPSMQGQTNQNFKWLVFFDVDTPEFFRKRIRECEQWDNFIPYYVESLGDSKKEAIAAHIEPGSTHLITTRLDDDDALSKTFVETVQCHFKQQEFGFLNFTNGFAFSTERDALYSKESRSNAFTSLIETVEDFKSVWCNTFHENYASLGPVEQIASEPAWMMVVHERNVANCVRCDPRVSINDLDGRFSINYAIDSRFERAYLFPLSNGLLKLRCFLRRRYWGIRRLAKRLMPNVVKNYLGK